MHYLTSLLRAPVAPSDAMAYPEPLLLRNCAVLDTVSATCDLEVRWDISLMEGRVFSVTRHLPPWAKPVAAAAARAREIDCRGLVLMPGLKQAKARLVAALVRRRV